MACGDMLSEAKGRKNRDDCWYAQIETAKIKPSFLTKRSHFSCFFCCLDLKQ